MFPADMIGPMMGPFVARVDESMWFVAEDAEGLSAFLYCAPELLTSGTHNLRAMATRADARRWGLGSALVSALEQALAKTGARVLLVETSSSPEFTGTCDFYRRRGFREEARIAGFWSEGEDKIIFWKDLTAPAVSSTAQPSAA
jgi:GNAT superfamily N-acetyltransferase